MVLGSRRDGDLDLFEATRSGTSASWAIPWPLSGINTSAEEANPMLDATGLRLWFDSDRPGGGDRNIYTVTRPGVAESFGSPVAVPELNSGDDDTDVWISEDNSHIVFTSARSGRNRIYEAYRIGS
jgi:hypothetical protein